MRLVEHFLFPKVLVAAQDLTHGREPNEATRTAKCNHPRLTDWGSTGADARAGLAGVSIQLLTPALVSEEA